MTTFTTPAERLYRAIPTPPRKRDLRRFMRGRGAGLAFDMKAEGEGVRLSADDPVLLEALCRIMLWLGYGCRWSGKSFLAIKNGPGKWCPAMAAPVERW